MNKTMPLLLAVVLAGCGPSSQPTETVKSLAANPERLNELRQQCKTDRAKLGDELCNRVAEATNRRFLGDGKTPYNPPKEAPKF
ncbi:EexN family lipoprotein [Burkholderia sp. BCC0419]|uniref:EexN family lipoprotein n=1 Tax=Burkholderia sp. BCC0419 TaxID=486878 RepID=UPI00158F36AF|nr:EexN family lipoprotein [Burkholderia sp. BCC0419]